MYRGAMDTKNEMGFNPAFPQGGKKDSPYTKLRHMRVSTETQTLMIFNR